MSCRHLYLAIQSFCVAMLLAGLPTGAQGAPGSDLKAQTPNIIIIYADDLGYGDLGAFGGRKIRTPHLDHMAKQGIRFTNFYVSQAVCSASRASLLTGKYSNRTGTYASILPSATHGLGLQHQTLADLLGRQGYVTALIGKWHLGHTPELLPTRRGFDMFYGLPYSNDMGPDHPTIRFPPLPLMEGERTIAINPDQSKLTGEFTARALAFIRQHRDQPFFLYYAPTAPHVPLHVGKRHRGKSAAGLYGDSVEELDWSVGQILDTLQTSGLLERTVVMFSSDNGPWLSYGNHAGSAGPLREGKGTAWEGGVRVPFIASWPGHIPAGSTQRQPAMTIDLLPTIAAMTGSTLPAGKLDGMDIRPLLFNHPNARSPQAAYYFYWNHELHAVRSGQWKLHFPRKYRSLNGRPPGADGLAAEYSMVTAGLELFDLAADPGESINVAARHPETVRRLSRLADHMRADLGDVSQ